MHHQQQMEDSKAEFHKDREKIPTGTITRGFFNVEDIDDYNNPDSPQSPTKMIPKRQKMEERVRKSIRKPKRDFKLDPLENQKPVVVNISNVNQSQYKEQDELEQLELEPTRSQVKKQENQREEQPPHNKKQENKKNIMFFGGDSEESDEEQQPRQQKKTERQVVQPVILRQQQINLEDHDVASRFGKEFQHVRGFQPLNFLIRRDKSWLNKLKPVFHLHSQLNNQYFFSAKLTGNNTVQTFLLSRSKQQFNENDENYLGKVKTNFVGNQVQIFGPGYNPTDAKQKNLALRQLMASIAYETNFFGSTKPRNFKVYLLKPSTQYYNLIGTKRFQEEVSLEELYKIPENRQKILVMANKKPEWNDEINGYMLNFGGKVKKASIKNFILEDGNNPDNVRMLFGKIDENDFRMDIGNPLSPFIGLGIALSAFGSKIGCQ